MGDWIAQVAIFILGPTAVFMANCHGASARKWAPVVGLTSQPFWFWTTIAHHQWPVMVTCVIYTGVWVVGIKKQWSAR